jgi:RNA polymerase-associated protein RTF1
MSKFTEDEWRRYRATMANEDCKLPTRKFINSKLDQINRLLTHRFTDHEITARMQAQNDLLEKITRSREKEELKEGIKAAIAEGDDDLAEELENHLASIVPMKLAFGTSLSRADSAQVSREQEQIAELNRRNQRLNAENVRKAQLAEMRARKSKKHLAPGVDELFEGGSDISRTGTPVNGTGTPKVAASISRAGTPNPITIANGTPRSSTPTINVLKPAAEKKKGLPVIRKAALDDEILANMDLGIDIDIDI